jgi:soluble lytic murein transglycosylase-like protein
MYKFSALIASLSFAASPAFAQVIDIDVNGEAVIYSEPTVFVNDDGHVVAERAVDPAQHSSSRQLSSLTASVSSVERTYGLPAGLVDAVIYQESRGRMDAVSPKGALGLMQLMPATAAQLGVNPYNADDNIRGGAHYLRQQIDRFGSIPLALAAYNAGPGAVLRYGGIPPFRETQNYVTTILSRWKPPLQPVTTAVSENELFAPVHEKSAFLIEVDAQ